MYFSGELAMSEEENAKRIALFEKHPKIKAYFQRVQDHQMLAKYFKERLTDEHFEF